MHIYIKLSGFCRNTVLLVHLLQWFLYSLWKSWPYFARGRGYPYNSLVNFFGTWSLAEVCSAFRYQGISLHIHLHVLFPIEGSKKAFYLFGYMMNCIKLLLRQSSQRKGFGFAWPAQCCAMAALRETAGTTEMEETCLTFPLFFPLCIDCQCCCAFCI